jgi:hypothetical protein
MYAAQLKSTKQSRDVEKLVKCSAKVLMLRQLVKESLTVRVRCKPAQPEILEEFIFLAMISLELPDFDVIFSILWLFLVMKPIAEQATQLIAKICVRLATASQRWKRHTVKV